MTREQIIATATRVAQIRQELQRLSSLQKELKELEARLDGLADEPTPTTTSRSRSSEGNLTDRVTGVVNTEPERRWTADDVNTILGENVQSVRAALSKAHSMGQIDKPMRGIFCAKGGSGQSSITANAA
jgi:hypothetical protein